MTPIDPTTAAVSHRARAQALFDAVLRTPADVPDGVRIHCAAAVSALGFHFLEIAAAREAAAEPVFDVEPAGDQVEAVLCAGLRELGRLPAEQFRQVVRAAEAVHDALAAMR